MRKRLSNHVSGEVAYTLSKTTDNAFNFVSSILVPERPDLQWGPGSDDRRHVVTGNVVVQMPFNLTLATIVEYRSEAPLNITVGRDVNGDGLTTDWVNEAICRNVSCPGYKYSRVFNFPLRNQPTESITSGNFGRVTSVLTGYQARALQFTLQVDF